MDKNNFASILIHEFKCAILNKIVKNPETYPKINKKITTKRIIFLIIFLVFRSLFLTYINPGINMQYAAAQNPPINSKYSNIWSYHILFFR